MDPINGNGTNNVTANNNEINDPTVQQVFAEALIGALITLWQNQRSVGSLTGVASDIDNLKNPLAE